MTTPVNRSWGASPAHLRAVVAGVLGVAAALLFRVPSLLVLATPFALVATWSAATRPPAGLTLVGQVGPASVREGEATTWTGHLTDTAGVDHIVVLARQRTWLETRPPSGVVTAGLNKGAEPTTIDVPMRVTHWGRQDVGPITVVGVSDWGAFRWTALDSSYRVTALPLPASFDAAAPMHRADGLVGLNRSAQPGDGSEFAGIRPFQSGDRLRRINWPRSVRSDELHVTSTYADQDTHVALFVDALADFGESGGIDGASSSLDTTVRAAGAIAEHFLLRGDRVSLRILDARFQTSVPPASGRRHLRRILDVLATIETNNSVRGLARQSNAAVPSGAMVIMLSPLISPAALERATTVASHGLSVAVIDTLPDDVQASDDATTELAWRIRLLERHREVRAMQRLGVPVVAWQGAGSLDPFLREIVRRATAPRLTRR